MGLLGDMEWPERLTPTLEAVVGQIPAELLTRVAANIPEFTAGGFRIAGAKVETLRRRALQLLRGGDVPDALRRLTADHSLQGRALVLLDEETLLRRRDELEACLGTECVLLGMLLDRRERVRKCAAERLAGLSTQPPRASEPARAKAAVQSLFGGLLGDLVPVLEMAAQDEGMDAAELPGPQLERIARLEADLRAAQERAGRAAGLEAKVSRQATTVEALTQERDQWRATAEARAGEAAAERAEVVRLCDALVTERASRELEVAARVAEQLASETFDWLHQAKDAAAQADDPAHADVAERARRLLERQRTVDRRAGTLSTLRQRLADLKELHAEVLRAQADALSPLPELAPTVAALAVEIARTERVPGVADDPACGSVTWALLARLGASDETGIADVDRLVGELERLDLLSEHERLRLRTARRDRLAQKLALGQAEKQASEREDRRGSFLTRWRKLTGSSGVATLLVDGHNLLLNARLPYERYREPDGSVGEGARRGLLRDVVALASMLQGSDARVFFDGPDAQETAAGKQVLVVFSGGVGENRADDRIVDYLRFRKTQAGVRRPVLVTDDRSLQKRARAEDRAVSVLSGVQFDELRRHVQASVQPA